MHPAFDHWSDYVDGLVPAPSRALLDAHLASCADCARTVTELRACLTSARTITSELAPPVDLWRDIRATVEARKVVAFPGVSPRRTVTPRWLAAAAVALVAVSSATTAWFMRAPVASAPAAALTVVPAAWAATEQGYLANVEDLRSQLDAQRDALDPATVATVERALRSIDEAIGEARTALARDPANAVLTDLLASNYRQKVELLRRATQLASST